MNISAWKDQYLEYCEFQRALSANTLKAYKRDIEEFIEFQNSQNETLSLSQIDDKAISKFLVHLFNNNIKPKSLARYRSSLNSLFSFLLNLKAIDVNPVELVNTPKIGKKLPEVLDVDTVARLLSIPTTS